MSTEYTPTAAGLAMLQRIRDGEGATYCLAGGRSAHRGAHNTIQALLRHGLLDAHRRITAKGREALKRA